MFQVNDDLSIYVTRGDVISLRVTAEKDGAAYTFQPGDVVRFKVYGKKDAENVALQKDFPVSEATESVGIVLDGEDTKIGEVISKPRDYWYEIELNPNGNPQTIIGYDEDGAKIFKLFPEGDDIPPFVPDPEDIKVTDAELDMTSDRPVQNQAVARAFVSLKADYDKTKETIVTQSSNTAAALAIERSRLDNLINHSGAGVAQPLEYLDYITEETKAKIDAAIASDGVFATVTVNLREANMFYGGSGMDVFIIPDECRPIDVGLLHTEDGLEYRISYDSENGRYLLYVGATSDVTSAPSGAGGVAFTYALDNYELKDVRVGMDGTVYKNAGTAVRVQMRRLNAFAESAVGVGLATDGSVRIANETNAGSGCTTEGKTPSQAYGNGTVFSNEVIVRGIRLHSGITATSFGAFVFDDTNTMIEKVDNITPAVMDGVFNFDTPVRVPSGGYMLLRFLDGVFFYESNAAHSLKEYRPGTNELLDSPIRVGIEYIYDDVFETVIFKDEPVIPDIQLKDYDMPRFTANKGEKYSYYGRWFDRVIGGKTYKAANADGSSLAFRVSGASKLNIGLHPITAPNYTPYFAYSIDGGDFVRQKITDTTIPIPDRGDHWIWIVIDGMGENDPVAGGKWYGSVGIYFTGVTSDGEVQGADASNKQIMFIGDSIVEGINVLGLGANADTNSATGGFAFKTARLLNAIPLLCGYGGTAVLGNSSFHKPIEAIDFNMNGVSVNEQHPDIICVEHGYNDGTLVSNGTYTADEFKAGYNALLDRIKVKYPGVHIVCIIPFKQSLREEITECAKGRKYCHVVETDGWGVTYTDSAHPNEHGANVAAEKLAKSIVELFGKQYFM